MTNAVVTLEQQLTQMEYAAVYLAKDKPEHSDKLVDIACIASMTRQRLETSQMPITKVIDTMNHIGNELNKYAIL